MRVDFTAKEMNELKKISNLVKEIVEELDLCDEIDTSVQLKNGTWVHVKRSDDGSMTIDLDADLMRELFNFTSTIVEASRPLWMVLKGFCVTVTNKFEKLTSKVENLCEFGIVEADLSDFGLTAKEGAPSYYIAVVERKKGSNVWTGVRDTCFGVVTKEERKDAPNKEREVLAFANKLGVIVERVDSHNEARDLMHTLANKSR